MQSRNPRMSENPFDKYMYIQVQKNVIGYFLF